MKKLQIIILTVLGLFFIDSTNAQSKVKEKNILGTWQLIIDVNEELDEAREEADEEDNFIEKITVKWVSGLVEGLLDEIEIFMEFLPDGDLKVTVDAFGERETEYTQWHIDEKGRLYIDDSETVSSDDNDFWMFEDDILISFKEDGKAVEREKNIYMARID